LTSLHKYIIVFVAGITGIWKGVPIGIGLNLHPVFIGLFTGLGSVTSALIMYFAGDSFRQWILRLYGEKRMKRKENRFRKLADQYGPWGLGLVTSGLFGPFTSVILGLLLLKDTRRFLYLLIIGILIWSVILAYIFTPLYVFLFSFKR